MARINVPEGSGLERRRVWSSNLTWAGAWVPPPMRSTPRSPSDVRVREIARMRVAQINQCHI